VSVAIGSGAKHCPNHSLGTALRELHILARWEGGQVDCGATLYCRFGLAGKCSIGPLPKIPYLPLRTCRGRAPSQ
jgi:hypothetical protein